MAHNEPNNYHQPTAIAWLAIPQTSQRQPRDLEPLPNWETPNRCPLNLPNFRPQGDQESNQTNRTRRDRMTPKYAQTAYRNFQRLIAKIDAAEIAQIRANLTDAIANAPEPFSFLFVAKDGIFVAAVIEIDFQLLPICLKVDEAEAANLEASGRVNVVRTKEEIA
jgi:hypothetical protein